MIEVFPIVTQKVVEIAVGFLHVKEKAQVPLCQVPGLTVIMGFSESKGYDKGSSVIVCGIPFVTVGNGELGMLQETCIISQRDQMIQFDWRQMIHSYTLSEV